MPSWHSNIFLNLHNSINNFCVRSWWYRWQIRSSERKNDKKLVLLFPISNPSLTSQESWSFSWSFPLDLNTRARCDRSRLERTASKSQDFKAYCQEERMSRRNDDPDTWTMLIEITAEFHAQIGTLKKNLTSTTSERDSENIITISERGYRHETKNIRIVITDMTAEKKVVKRVLEEVSKYWRWRITDVRYNCSSKGVGRGVGFEFSEQDICSANEFGTMTEVDEKLVQWISVFETLCLSPVIRVSPTFPACRRPRCSRYARIWNDSHQDHFYANDADDTTIEFYDESMTHICILFGRRTTRQQSVDINIRDLTDNYDSISHARSLTLFLPNIDLSRVDA